MIEKPFQEIHTRTSLNSQLCRLNLLVVNNNISLKLTRSANDHPNTCIHIVFQIEGIEEHQNNISKSCENISIASANNSNVVYRWPKAVYINRGRLSISCVDVN